MFKSIKRFFVPATYFVVSLFLLLPGIAGATGYSKIIAFGDSLSDHSGLQRYIGAYDPVSNPYGALTTWSNGDVWLDYLKTDLNVELDDRAIAGAMTEGHEDSTIQSMIDAGRLPDLGFDGQIDMFIASHPVFDPATTLFAMWIGGNDLLEFSRGESKYTTPDALIVGATAVVTQDMEKLYAEGARKFLILNLPDIGMAPAFVNSSTQVKSAATLMSSMYNQMLWSRVDQFVSAHSDVTVIKFDIFSYINSQLASGVFPNTTGTYVKYDENGNRTSEYNEPASDYFFWDKIHPTTKAHGLLAGEVSTKIKESQTPDNGGGTDDDNSGSDSGSSSCFISTASASSLFSNANLVIIIGFGSAFLVFFGRKKD